MPKQLMKGNEAIAEAAIQAGAIHYFCYPITPQTEVAEYLAKRLPEIGGVFVQAESELAAANMIFGAAATGKRVFTSSSSPGISLMQEAISYIAGAHLPAVFINIVRGGPGLGGILPAQSDYFQSTKGGGHGDYRLLVLAPASVQESADLTMLAFDLAEKYRAVVMLMGDGMIGQMMEPVEFPKAKKIDPTPKDWAVTGAKGRKPNLIKSLYLDPDALEKNCIQLAEKYEQMKKEEIRFEAFHCTPQTEVLLVAYGTTSRICKTVIEELEEEGIHVGLFRPITLFPFPEKQLFEMAQSKKTKFVLSVEMSMGQMVEDVERIVKGTQPVYFFGRTGGIVPSPEEIKIKIKDLLRKKGEKHV